MKIFTVQNTLWITFVTMILGLVVLIYVTNKYEKILCVEESKVVEILAINYRSATILLENGKKEDVTQATLKPGDMYCLERKIYFDFNN